MGKHPGRSLAEMITLTMPVNSTPYARNDLKFLMLLDTTKGTVAKQWTLEKREGATL